MRFYLCEKATRPGVIAIFKTLLLCITPMLVPGCTPERPVPGQDPFSGFEAAVARITSELQPVRIPKDTIDLIAFAGHSPDQEGTFDFASAINHALLELSDRGGGVLHFRHTRSPETWVKRTETYRVRGPVLLQDNVELLFDHAVRLFFEFAPEAYLLEGKGALRRYEGTTIYSFYPQIYAFRKKNIRIAKTAGNGAMPVIDGDGERWVSWARDIRKKRVFLDQMSYYDDVRDANRKDLPLKDRVFTDPEKHPYRPTMMEFFLSQDVEVSGVKLKNAPFWVVHPVFSRNLHFHDMIFDCQNVNNDGFDPESSDNILIERIIFDNHDDNVVAKAGRDFEGRKGVDIRGTELEGVPSEYIRGNRLGGAMTDLVFRNSTVQGHHAFAVGSEMSGGVERAYVYNCQAPIKVKAGVFIKSSRRRGGYVRDVYVKGMDLHESDMALSLIPNYDGDTLAPYPPLFEDIHFKDITVDQTVHSIQVYGWEDAPTRNVSFQNIEIREADYPPAYNHIRDLKMEKVSTNGEITDIKVDSLIKKDFIPPERT